MRAALSFCKVCGYDNSPFMPWGDDAMTASYSIRPCCGVEFGYEDVTAKSTENYRKKWLSNGAPWFNDEIRPQNWNVGNQLKNIGVDAAFNPLKPATKKNETRST